VGLTSRVQRIAISKIEYAVQITGAASSETCTVGVIEKGAAVDVSTNAHRSGLVWPLKCDAGTNFQLWLHRNGKVQYAVDGVVFYESKQKPRDFPLVRCYLQFVLARLTKPSCRYSSQSSTTAQFMAPLMHAVSLSPALVNSACRN